MEPRFLNVFLPQMFDLTSFAPHLETLEIISYFWHNPEFPANLERLDRGIESHASLQRVVIVELVHGFGINFLSRLKEEMNKCMPRCTGRGMMEFELKYVTTRK